MNNPQPHRTPVPSITNSSALSGRLIDELIGVCRGVLLDGVVTQSEANGLLRWLERNREVADHWPANVLYARIARMMEDGHLDGEEERELIATLVDITGDQAPAVAGSEASASLPVSQPVPTIHFNNRRFCLAGKFVSGSRRQLGALLSKLGATIDDEPTSETNYLIIGAVGSNNWQQAGYADKVHHCAALRERGCDVYIVAEENWVGCLPD